MTPTTTYYAASQTEERIQPRTLLCLAPAALWFILAAYLPDTWTPKPVLFDVPVRGGDLVILFTGLLSFGGWLLAGNQAMAGTRWHRNLPLYFTVILAYAAISTLWAGQDLYYSRGMLYSLAFAAAAFMLPFSVIASLEPRRIRSLTRVMALALAFTGAIYSLESFVGLGLRSELGHFYTYGFGVERVKGPLFEASTGYMILIPAAAVLLQDLFDSPNHSILNLAGLLSLSVTIVGLGSRFALVATGVFLVAIIVTSRSARNFLIGFVALAGVAVAALIVFQYASGERLLSFNDPARLATYTTSFNIVQNRHPGVSLAGSGYGSVWPWYVLDWDLGERIARGHTIRETDFGPMLFQPHSVLLMFGVELGALGLAVFLYLWGVIGRLVSSAVLSRGNVYAAIGVAAGGLGMFADTILFKGPKVSALWWFFLLSALALHAAGPQNTFEEESR